MAIWGMQFSSANQEKVCYAIILFYNQAQVGALSPDQGSVHFRLTNNCDRWQKHIKNLTTHLSLF